MEEYFSPKVYFEIEDGTNKNELNKLKEAVADSAYNPPQYITAYKGLLHLEEVAEFLHLQKFNQLTLTLNYSNFGNIFELTKNVSSIIVLSIVVSS